MDSSSEEMPEGENGNRNSLLKIFFLWLKSVLGLRSTSLKESLEEAIEEQEAAGGAIDHEEKVMLRNVITFSELAVEDVMVPKADIISVAYDISLDELKKTLSDKAHTRLPVYRGTLDDIAGFIHLKDLMPIISFDKAFEMEKMLRQILFVPPSMKVSTLLIKMQMSRVHIAIVVDEHGGVTGLVTLEDLVEEIVGEIEDEHDTEDGVFFKQLSDNMFEVSARIGIDTLEEKLGMKLKYDYQENEFDTLGGMIFSMLGRVPAIGEIATHNLGLEFEVTDADLRKIKRVIIRKNVEKKKISKAS